MLKTLFPKNTIQLLPLLAVYIIVVLLFSKNDFFGDESRHYHYALNLTEGFYEDTENPNLRNGPGYPLILAPFVALGTDFIVPKLFNAFLLFFSILYFKKTIDLFTKNKYSLLLVYLLGLYPPIIRYVPLLYSEPLAYFTFCGMAYHFCRLFLEERINWKHLIAASFFLAFLVLTKIIYLQVILVSLLLLALTLLWKRNHETKKSILILIGGFFLITPYLLYTYSLTGKVLYVGTGGGEILYHRSTPFEHELGSWFSKEDVLYGQNKNYSPSSDVYKDLSELSKNHRDFYLTLESLSNMERDSAFKSAAIDNMKAHPIKYLKNTIANIGRFAFHYPFSYRPQNLNTYGFMLPNAFLLMLWGFSLYPFFLVRKTFPYSIQALMVFSLIYAGGIILLDGRARNFVVMAPVLILFFGYVYTNVLKIKTINYEE
ncbi:hypothetical protein D9O36_06260 [Zobellia amurskyensis]|uniref:Dolichyl-phosphate-mannose-protein mannosyltransferase n=1 Tax=Zobellia amurskyensis TaxID=248905 RepID=A0A7X3D1H1_9FLAO|nr:hypothetical protein [Zobellia amurskyensis]MUH35436.1 hypothetical protein [Zobellia amurskyensis]